MEALPPGNSPSVCLEADRTFRTTQKHCYCRKWHPALLVRSPRRCAVPVEVIVMIRCVSCVTLESGLTRKERTESCTNIARQLNGFAISPPPQMLMGWNEGNFGRRNIRFFINGWQMPTDFSATSLMEILAYWGGLRVNKRMTLKWISKSIRSWTVFSNFHF